MPETAYRLNLGLESTAKALDAATTLNPGDLPAALRTIADSLGRARANALQVAAFVEQNPPTEVFLDRMVFTTPPPKELFEEDTRFVLPSQVVKVLERVSALSQIENTKFDLTVEAPLTGTMLAEGFARVEVNDLSVMFVVMDARCYSDLRKFGRDLFNTESRTAMLKLGVMGDVWGAHILVTKNVPAGSVYILSSRVLMDVELTHMDVCCMQVTR